MGEIKDRAKEMRKWGRQYRHNTDIFGSYTLTNSCDDVECACILMGEKQLEIDVARAQKIVEKIIWQYVSGFDDGLRNRIMSTINEYVKKEMINNQL